MFVTLRAVEKHVTSIFAKLGLPATHRRPPPRPRRPRLPARLTHESPKAAAAKRTPSRSYETRICGRRYRSAPEQAGAANRTPRHLDAALLRALGRAILGMQSNDPGKEARCHRSSTAPTSRPAWVAGARATARPPSSAGSRSSSRRSRSAPSSACRRSTTNDTNVGEARTRRPDHPRRRLQAGRAVRVRARAVEDADGRRSRPSARRRRRRRARSSAFTQVDEHPLAARSRATTARSRPTATPS